MLLNLEQAISSGDKVAVQDAIFALSSAQKAPPYIDDEIAFGILKILSRKEMKSSSLSGHILNFFEFEARYLSPVAKSACREFLKKEGFEFSGVHSVQVVTELVHGPYLR